MFSALTPGERIWLIALLALWAALLFGGFLFGRPHASPPQRMPTWARLGSSLTLAAAAWSWVAFAGAGTPRIVALLIAIGMTLGCLGDVLLAEIAPLAQPLIAGMAAFGLGHLAYIAALIIAGNVDNLTAVGLRWGALAVWLVIGVAGWYAVVMRGHSATLIQYAALPYTLLLASVTGLAWGLALQSGAYWAVAVGATLFLASDLILAAQTFQGLRFQMIGDLIWLTYGPGQMLVVYGMGAALLSIGVR
ncbi:MAG: hypothetical protein OJF49_003843 [Ktedonobacterales bacterium]|jgi:hypothetical protein|nr:MAG: hypothetical protein OJF49_003843 [Ktedonobacterales bacterium]